MNLNKHYRFTFDLLGFLLFLMIMLPNFIWFAIPAPQDVLRTAKSVFPMIEKLGSIFQILFIATLCLLRNVPQVPLKKRCWRIGIMNGSVVFCWMELLLCEHGKFYCAAGFVSCPLPGITSICVDTQKRGCTALWYSIFSVPCRFYSC